MSKAPDTTVYVQPTVSRANIEWTPDLIKVARAMADSGDLSLAADFCEFAMADERVSSGLSTRANGLLSLPLSFEPAKGGKRAVRALEADEDYWAAYPETEASQVIKWGILLGVGLAKQAWTDRGSTINRLIPKLEVWHPRNLKKDMQRNVWQVQTTKGLVDITPGDGKWVLYTPYGGNRPWAFGAWRAIALWTVLELYAIEDWGQYSGKTGRGNLVANTPENYDKKRRNDVAREIFDVDGNASIALPNGVTLKLLESTANTWETFQAQIDVASRGKSIAILGQNLSTEVNGPAATGATLHGKVLQVYIDMDGATWTMCVREQSLVFWAELNFGAKEYAPWPKYDTKPPEDRKAQAEIVASIASTITSLVNAGAPVDVRALLERHGVPLKDPKDIEQSGQVYKYHLDYGVLTLNEIRERLGLPAMAGGSEAPKPLVTPGGVDSAEKAFGPGSATPAGESDRVASFIAGVESIVRELAEKQAADREALQALQVQTELQARRLEAVDLRVDNIRDMGRAETAETNVRIADLQREQSRQRDHITQDHEAIVRLRSGRLIRAASGFVQGQAYTDRIGDDAVASAPKVLADDVAAVLAAVNDAKDYDDMRKRLVKAFQGMSSAALADMTAEASILCHLAGRHAVNEERE